MLHLIKVVISVRCYQKNPNELFGQPNSLENKVYDTTAVRYIFKIDLLSFGGKREYSSTCMCQEPGIQ